MKKKVLILTIAFLSILMLGFSMNGIQVAKANIIFSTSFQSGNLSDWSVTYGALAIDNQTTNNGDAYSVQNIVVGQNENLYYHSLGTGLPNPIAVREYVYINSTTLPSVNGDYYQVGGFSTSTGGNYGDGELIVTNVGGTLYWGIFYPNGAFSRSISTSNSTSTAVRVTAGVWTCLELRETTASSAGSGDGEEQFYVNGNLIADIKNVYNGFRTPANVVIGGSQTVTNPSETWNYYIDDVVVSDSYIGLNQNLLTTSSNVGTVTPSGQSYYAEGQQVTITATPPSSMQGERYVFTGWTGTGLGGYSGMNNPATITMNGNITETATWEHQYYLTVSSDYGTTGNSGWYDAGTSATATIPSGTVAGTTGTQYVFAGWSGNASGTGLTSNPITMNGPATANATWTTQYYLTTTSAHGTVTGSGWFNSGGTATATLNSLTAPGTTGVQYAFTNWGGDASGNTLTSNPIAMTGPKNAIVYWQTQYNMTFTQSGVGSDYTGTLVTVNGNAFNSSGYSIWANANSVYTFNYSSSAVVSATTTQYLIAGVTGNTTSTSVTVSAPTTVTASYRAQYYLTVTSQYDSPAPSSAWYDNNTSITEYVSSPASGYYCSGWTGTGSVPASGGSSVVTFTINAPSTLTWTWASTATPTPPPVTPTPPPVTPTPPPTHTPPPTASPSPSPEPSTSPTATPTSSSKHGGNTGIGPYVLPIVIVVIIVVAVAAAIMALRRKKA